MARLQRPGAGLGVPGCKAALDLPVATARGALPTCQAPCPALPVRYVLKPLTKQLLLRCSESHRLSPSTGEPVKGWRRGPQPSHPQPAPARPPATPEVPPPSGPASGRPSQCVAYRFQLLGRRLNTSEGPIEAAAGEGPPSDFQRDVNERLAPPPPPPIPPRRGPPASSPPNDIPGPALGFGGSLTRAGVDFFLTDLSLTPN